MHGHLLTKFGAQNVLNDLFSDPLGPGDDATRLKPFLYMDGIEQGECMIEVIQFSSNFGILCRTRSVLVPLVPPKAGPTLMLEQVRPDLLLGKYKSK